MRTQEMLERMPKKNRDYLENLKDSMKKMKEIGQSKVADEYKQVGKGYIKGMVDCGVLEDFKPCWCWFTL